MVEKNVDVKTQKLRPNEKFCLTVEEASAYFEICPQKIRAIAEEHMEDGIFTRNGVKLLVLRTPFENFLMKTETI